MARTRTPRTRRWWMVVLSVGAAGAMAACSGDSTAPTNDTAPNTTDSTSTPGDSTSTPGDSTTTPTDSTTPPGDSTGGSESSPDSTLNLSLGFVRCQAQSYATSTVNIGPAGGVIQVNGHKLTVPAGALDSTVAITMEAPSDTIRSVRFSPEGLTFDPAHRPVLDMNYSGCSLLSLLLSKKIVYTDDQLNILQALLSLDLLSLFKVEADLDHFSRYAIHY